MKAIVFGGSGFLGSYVVDELDRRGHQVTIFDRKPSPWRPDLPAVIGDILDRDLVERSVRGFDLVYNLAGAANVELSVDFPLDFLEVNVIGNANILQAARLAQAKRFVYASSAYALSEHGAFYGTSKRASEKVIELYQTHYGLDYTILRYGSVYGSRADAGNRIYRLLHQALTEKRLSFPGDGSEEREYIHAQDAARLSVDVLDDWGRNGTFILTGVERFNYRQLLGLISEILGGGVEIDLGNKAYQGHYTMTPYSFSASLGRKLISNPCIDFGQGLLECIETLHETLHPDTSHTLRMD